MLLSDFIHSNNEAIVAEWETFAGTLRPAAEGMSRRALRDHAQEILAAIVADLEQVQTDAEQTRKSQGAGEEQTMKAVGKTHAALRIQDGFRLSQLVAEYRALRASILRLFAKAGGTDLNQVTRFNESIDEALVEATSRYLEMMDRTRDQFLGILGHDLRNPLSAILMNAALLTKERGADEREVKIGARIESSAGRMHRMVNDLLDLTRTRLGSGIPIAPTEMDLETASRAVIAEFEACMPDRLFEFHAEGNLQGVWDPDRLAQVLSNLIGNALQHGAEGRPIEVRASEGTDGVLIEIHNEGDVIPHAQLANIFEPMAREAGRANEAPREGGSSGLGLGLHITREIVIAHEGTVSVSSTETDGTTFSVRLPRHSTAASLSLPKRERPDQHDASGEFVG